MNRTCYGVCLLIGLALAGGCRSTPPPQPLPASVTKAQQQQILAQRLSDQANWASATAAWGDAANQFALLDDRTNQVIALQQQALAWREQGQNSNALIVLHQAEELTRTMTNTASWWLVQIRLAQLECRPGLGSSALDRWHELMASAAGIPSLSLRGLFYHELAVCEMEQGQLAPAAQHLQQAEALFQQAKDGRGLASSLANQARLHMKSGDPKSAIPLWQEARNRFRQLGDTSAIAWCLLGEGQALLEANTQLSLAEQRLRRAAQNYALLRNRPKQRDSLEALAVCLERNNRAEEARTVRRELDALKSLR